MGDGLVRGSLLGPELGPDKQVIERIGHLPVGPQLDAVLHVGDALGGQGVGAQIGGSVVLIDAAELLQATEEGSHVPNVEAGPIEQLQAEAIGLALEVARVVELVLDRRALAGDGGAHGHVRIAAGREDGDREREQRGHLALILSAHHACHVALRDMGDLVGEHRGQFGFRLRGDDQAAVNTNVAAGKGESVEGCIPQGEELELLPAVVELAGEPTAQPVQVTVDFWIVDVGRFAQANLAHDRFADAPLGGRRQIRLGHFAEIRQFVGPRGRHHGGHDRGDAQRNPAGAHGNYDNVPPASFRNHRQGICKRMSANARLTHFDAAGQAHMVDVGGKPETERLARAAGRIRMQPATLAVIREGAGRKGDVLGVARIAAIQAAKRTGELIPLCHPIPLTRVAVEFRLDEEAGAVDCEAVAQTVGRTGVEMEALTAASVALLTIYDMCKAVDRGMVIEEVRLLEKAGGKSGHWLAK